MDGSFAVTRKLVKKERRLQLERTSRFPQGWDPPPPVNWELHQEAGRTGRWPWRSLEGDELAH